MSIFKGAGVAIATPMKENMEVDFDALHDNIDYQVDHGCDAIIIAGTTGEGSTLSIEEHLKVIKAAVEFTDHRIPVIAGTGSNCTETAVELSEEADSYGVDGLLVVTPYYNKATQDGLIKHYSVVADAVKAPIIMYNVPSRTGCNIAPETAAYIVKNVDNVVGIKDAVGNLSQTADMMNLCDGQIELYSGNDDQILPILSLGGLGVISVLCNVAPQQTHDMIQAWFDGDTQKAAKLQLDAIPLIHALFCEVNPIPVKAALEMMGQTAGPLRLPLTEISPEHRKFLKKEMKNYGLLKK